ncbi:unnamed protein product [Acanthoscelides obtectus]|uniref:Transposase n=1 Tax=Acanthoscelides obtectus TaxID=200917 RepID=A0A9P0PSQ1_ACAOB|nr:unnamed protein product [Acanthoscelides obtectus]CAK1664358.1 hypothetical protein AOBTE_LOCUS24219 [Acanthoscelides obtectus]
MEIMADCSPPVEPMKSKTRLDRQTHRRRQRIGTCFVERSHIVCFYKNCCVIVIVVVSVVTVWLYLTMKSTNGTSGSTESQGTSRRFGKALKRDAKEIVPNVFNYLNRTMCMCIRRVVHEKKKTGATTDPKFNLKGRKAIKLDDDSKMALRRTEHSFFFRNEIPTLKAVHAAIKENEIIPQMSVEVMRKSLHEINFRYETRNRKSVLIERPEIVAWRRKYLREMIEYRRQSRKIYYLDETWVNAGHTVKKTWIDKNVVSNRQASIEGLSTGLRGPFRYRSPVHAYNVIKCDVKNLTKLNHSRFSL